MVEPVQRQRTLRQTANRSPPLRYAEPLDDVQRGRSMGCHFPGVCGSELSHVKTISLPQACRQRGAEGRWTEPDSDPRGIAVYLSEILQSVAEFVSPRRRTLRLRPSGVKRIS